MNIDQVGVLAAGVPAPTGLTATGGILSVDLSWTAPPQPVTYTYTVHRATTAGGPYSPVATGVPGTTYTDPTALGGTTYYYVVTAVSVAESGFSNEASAAATNPPPRTNDHDEGLFDGKCACNTIGGGAVAFPLALLGLVFLLRRR